MKPYVVVVDDGDQHLLRVLAHALSIPEPVRLAEYRPSVAFGDTANCFTNCSNFCLSLAGVDWPLKWAEIREGFEAFLTKLAPVNLHPNPLIILSRALNARLPMRSSFVPRWRRGRWKAKS